MMPHYLQQGQAKKLVLPYGHECVGILPAHKPSAPRYFVVVAHDGESMYYVDVATLECKGAHRMDESRPS